MNSVSPQLLRRPRQRERPGALGWGRRFDFLKAAFAEVSRFSDVPNVVAIIAFDIARLLVILPEIERLTLIGPLFAAVVAGDDRPLTGILAITGHHQRRPIGGALAVAG